MKSRCKLPPLPIPAINIVFPPPFVLPSLPIISISFKCPLDILWPLE